MALAPALAAAPVFDSLGQQVGQENQTFSFSVHATDADNDPLLYGITNAPQGASLNTATGQLTWTPAFDQSGSYTLEFFVNDGSSTVTQSVPVAITNTNRPPVLIELSSQTISENQSLQLNILASDADGTTPSYTASPLPAGAFFSSVTGLLSWSPTHQQAGSYQITLGASDGLATDTQQITITVQDASTAPSISLISPTTAVEQSFTTLNVSTDRAASCRYASGSPAFDAMSAFEFTGAYRHGTLLQGLSGSTSYTVRCQSPQGDIGSASFTITRSQGPTADITLDPDSPLQPGLVSVRLVSSVPLQSAPSLTYAFDETPSERKLVSLEALSGSSTIFVGHIVIPKLAGIRTGSFEFKGLSQSGVQGTLIESGKTFIADDVNPPAPRTFRVETTTAGLRLVWIPFGESAREFRVYRHIGPGVSLADYYTSVNGTEFTDSQLVTGTVYAYRISAVDLAGNEGELSTEAAAAAPEIKTATGTPATTATIIPPKLSISSQKRLNATVKEIERAMLDIDLAVSTIESLDGEAIKLIVDAAGVRSSPTVARAELEAMRNEIKALDLYTASDEDMDLLIQKAQLRLRKANLTAVKAITITDDSQSLQSISPERLQSLKEASLAKLNLSGSLKGKYEAQFDDWNGKLKVNVRVITASLRYLDGHEELRTLVQKDITLESPQMARTAYVMERIPKEIAQKASEMTFDPKPEVIESDPLVRWSLPEADFQHLVVSYLLPKKLSADTIRGTSTYLLQDPDYFMAQQPAQINSFTIFPVSDFKGGWSVLLIAAGVLLIVGLAGFYGYITLRNRKKLPKWLKDLKLPSFRKKKADAQKGAGVSPIDFEEPKVEAKPEPKPEVKPEPTPDPVQVVQPVVQQAPIAVQQTVQAPAQSAPAEMPAFRIPDPFKLADGRRLYTIHDLIEALDTMDEAYFSQYVNDGKNDFSNWLHGSLGETDLAFKLYSIKNKQAFKSQLFKLYTESLIAKAHRARA